MKQLSAIATLHRVTPNHIKIPNVGNDSITRTFWGSYINPAFLSMTTWAKPFCQSLQMHQSVEEANWANLVPIDCRAPSPPMNSLGRYL